MKIELVDKKSAFYESLSAFCEQHKVLFNTQAWLSVYSSKFVHQCAILNNNNEVIGCFIYYKFKKAGFTFIITPPYAPHIDLYYVNPAVSVVGKNTFDKEVSETIAAYFKKLKYDYLNLNFPLFVIDSQPFIWQMFQSRHRFTYLIDLKQSEEQLWDNLASEKRKSIKKAEKDDLKIELTQDYKTVYDLVLKSLSRNEKAKNLEIIRAILFQFSNQENSFAFIAKNKDGFLSASFCLIYGTKAMYLFGGFSSDNSHHGAHVSCLWQSILYAKNKNLQFFDFEGSMNKNIERYFREFGGLLKNYTCIEDVKPGINLLLKLKGGLPI